MNEQRWDGRRGCLDALHALEDMLEGTLTEKQRDLFEYAYMKGFDKATIILQKHITLRTEAIVPTESA